MMKGLMFYQQQQQQQQQQVVVEENMSNLTSASNEASNSVSSGNNRTETGSSYLQQQQYLAPPTTSQSTTQPPKKKRNLPGNPDPDAEVIALSPKSLLATNRFICEICNKGFQRDQNLQLHRRGHNLPWKLKQRTNKEAVKKKVYVCPEPTCVHHDPSRALGDLTGIKKHFFRKHGEKKWKCDKCSKRYAVQSDWKAHSKTCGTREYRCDCGTLFSRRDSFITHRAFCDALAEENARRAITANNNINLQTQFNPQDNNTNNFPLKKEHNIHHHQSFNLINRPEIIPPWLIGPQNNTTRFDQQDLLCLNQTTLNPNPNHSFGPTIPAAYQAAAAAVPSPAHMSATALLQKAAQMGASMSSTSSIAMIRPPQQGHVTADPSANNLNLSSRDPQHPPITTCSTTTTTTTATATAETISGLLAPFGNKAAFSSSANASSILCDVMMMNSFSSASSGGFEGTNTTFDDDAFGAILNNSSNLKKDDDDENLLFHDTLSKTSGGGGGKEGLTRDFLGLRPLSHSDILTIAGIGNCMNNNDQQNQCQKPWQG